jgi:hypothetical protein
MDEGVDPTQMCQTLVDKVFQSKQLKAVAEPEILVLFENWLDEVEEEVVSAVRAGGPADPLQLAEQLGMSRSGALFLMTKLQREGRIK